MDVHGALPQLDLLYKFDDYQTGGSRSFSFSTSFVLCFGWWLETDDGTRIILPEPDVTRMAGLPPPSLGKP